MSTIQPPKRDEYDVGCVIILLLMVMFMMAWSLFASAQIAHGQDVPAPIGDVEFRIAQEEFVRATGTIHDLDQVIPSVDARMIRRLGCEHFDCREAASKDIAAEGPRMFKALVWGGWHKDAEIASRCDLLMDLLTHKPCQRCSGTGQCREYADAQCYTCVYSRDYEGFCHECKGAKMVPIGGGR